MWSSLRKQADLVRSLTHDRLQAVTAHARELAKEVMTEGEGENEQQGQEVEDEIMHALTHNNHTTPNHHQHPSSSPQPSPSPSHRPLHSSPPLHPSTPLHTNGHAPAHFSYLPSPPQPHPPHVSISHHDDGEEKEVEIIDDPLPSPSHAPLPLFSPASASPSSVPPHSLRDSTPTTFFSTLPTASPQLSSVASSPSSSSRLRVELEEREGEVAGYREELALVRQQRRTMEDRHETQVLEYQALVRQQQEQIERLTAQPALHRSSSQHFDLPAQSPRAGGVADETHSREVEALQRKMEQAEASGKEEVAALTAVVEQLRAEKEAIVHSHSLAMRRSEEEHEQLLLSLQSQLQSIKTQLRESTERCRALEAQLTAAKSTGPAAPQPHDEEEDAREERLRQVRAEYESEIESLRRELMIASAKLSQSTPTASANSTSAPSAFSSSPALQAQVSSLLAAQAESASLISSLRESNSKLTAELKAAVSVREAMVAWRGEVQGVMAKWKKEREEREGRVRELKRRVRTLEKEREELVAGGEQERVRWGDAEVKVRREVEAREQERELSVQEERSALNQRIRELEADARRVWEEHAREREAVEAGGKREVEQREAEKSRLREELMTAQRDRELAERDAAVLEKQLSESRSEHEATSQLLEQARSHTLVTAMSQEDVAEDFGAERAALLRKVELHSQEAVEAKHEVERLVGVISDLEEQSQLRAEQELKLRAELQGKGEAMQALAQRVDDLTAQLQAVRQQPSTPTVVQVGSAGADGKVKELQSMLKQARDGYESLSRRFTEVQSECRVLMKKEEATNAAIAQLTQEVQRLKSAGNDDLTAQLSEAALQERLQQADFDLQNKAKEADDWERKYRQLLAEQTQALKVHAESKEKASAGVDEREEEVRSLRHQVQQLTLDASAMESLAQDLAGLQRASASWAKEKATMTKEVERLMAMVSAESEGRERELQQRERELEQLREKTEAGQHAVEQVEHLSRELSLLNANLQQVREQLLASQRQAKALNDENATLKKGMEETMHRLQRFHAEDEGQSIDRRLVVKMLVTFFEKGQRQEVLDLMYRILHFSDDDKRRVDLSRGVGGAAGLGGRLLSFASLLSPFDSEKARLPAKVEETSLADLWVDFLLKESSKGEDAGKPRGTGKIYEAMGSPAAATQANHSSNPYSTPQNWRSQLQPAPSAPLNAFTFSTPQVQPPREPVQPATSAAMRPAPVMTTSAAPHLVPNAVPISLPAHLRPPFPVPARGTPLPAFNFASHPVLQHPLPRMPVPGVPVSTAALRPLSPSAGVGGAAMVPPVAVSTMPGSHRFGNTSPVPMTPTLLSTPQPTPPFSQG